MNQSERFDGIDFLRGVAIIYVIISHASFMLWDKLIPNYFNSGSIGVDLFFSISGFVVSRSYWKWINQNNANANLKLRITSSLKYILKRFVRLLPVSTLWLLIFLLLTIYFNQSGFFGVKENVFHEAFAIIFFYYNYFLADTGNYRLIIYWSLMAEEHFYFGFALLSAFFISHKNFYKFLISFLILILAYRIFGSARGMYSQNQLLYYSHLRLDGLILGTILGIMSLNNSYHKTISKYLVKIKRIKYLIVLLIYFLPTILGGNMLGGWEYLVVGIICTISVGLFSLEHRNRSDSSELYKFLVIVGKRSYSIYLIHFTLMVVLLEVRFRIFNEQNHWPTPMMIFPVTVIYVLLLGVLTEINYQLVEKKFIKLSKKI